MSDPKPFIDMGFNAHVAEALAENDLTPDDVKYMSVEEIFGKFLEWNGILGYTSMITNALDNIRNVEAL